MGVGSAFRLICSTALFTSGISLSASGVPVSGAYVDDGRCDLIFATPLSHELGELPAFPTDEAIVDVSISPDTPICVADDGFVNDFVVSMTNASPTPWTDVFFVADDGFTVGNADGTVEDLFGAPGILTDAFKIDGTVTPGLNSPLIFESFFPANEIFEPGEIWIFRITNFTGGSPVFDSPGFFSGSSAGSPPSNASLLANPVPEPVAGTLLLAGLAWLGLRRRA